MITVQYRRVFADSSVTNWKDWPEIEIGEFDSKEQVINLICRLMSYDREYFKDVSFDKIGIYQRVYKDSYHVSYGMYQFKFLDNFLDWTLNIKDLL